MNLESAMQWIPVEKRLPDDRRRVFVCIESTLLGGMLTRSAGVSRSTPDSSGGRFDVEKPGSWFLLSRVTHWCEIELPPVQR